MSAIGWWPAYLGIGALVGFLAGMLGVGGGMVMVPMLVFVFKAQGLATDVILHLALGTAMCTIVFTAASSVRAHHVRGAVDWPVARAMAPGMLAGAFCASSAAGLIPTRPLGLIFTSLMFYAAAQMLVEVKPKPGRLAPGPVVVFAAGSVIGGVSSLLAAGGAFLSIPFLTWCNVPLRRAIGTAAANGFPIALAGSAGYVVQGLHADGLPRWSLGYVYLPALAMIVATSMLAATLGARAAHRLPVKRLRIIFAVVMSLLGLRMLATIW